MSPALSNCSCAVSEWEWIEGEHLWGIFTLWDTCCLVVFVSGSGVQTHDLASSCRVIWADHFTGLSLSVPPGRDENCPPTSPAAKANDVILYVKDSASSSPPKHFAKMASGTRRSRCAAPALPVLPVDLQGPRALPEHWCWPFRMRYSSGTSFPRRTGNFGKQGGGSPGALSPSTPASLAMKTFQVR